jgi:hypothetical protein
MDGYPFVVIVGALDYRAPFPGVDNPPTGCALLRKKKITDSRVGLLTKKKNFYFFPDLLLSGFNLKIGHIE